MTRFLVRHRHTPARCPARDPDRGAMLLNHLSRARARAASGGAVSTSGGGGGAGRAHPSS